MWQCSGLVNPTNKHFFFDTHLERSATHETASLSFIFTAFFRVAKMGKSYSREVHHHDLLE